jgi:drug/metabolite transporter (DMT)-like permease
MLAALVAAIGAALVIYTAPHSPRLLTGFLLVQGSAFCFALGQLAWRRERARFANGLSDAQLFALPYAGAVALALAVSGFTTDWCQLATITPTQFATIAYLGIVASGLCFFWWNVGARHVNAGILAALNNAKVPLGVACSLLFFGEQAELPLLVLSLTLLGGALWIAGRKK